MCILSIKVFFILQQLLINYNYFDLHDTVIMYLILLFKKHKVYVEIRPLDLYILCANIYIVYKYICKAKNEKETFF